MLLRARLEINLFCYLKHADLNVEVLGYCIPAIPISVLHKTAFCYSLNSRDIMPVGSDTNYVLCRQNFSVNVILADLVKFDETDSVGR